MTTPDVPAAARAGSQYDGGKASKIGIITWGSHGSIHYLDAVRGGLWHLRNQQTQRLQDEVVQLAIVGIAWKRKRATCSIETRHVEARRVGADYASSAGPGAGISADRVEHRTISVKTASLIGLLHALRVFFGVRLVKEPSESSYEACPVLAFNSCQVGDLIASEHLSALTGRIVDPEPKTRIMRHIDRARRTYYAYLTYVKAKRVLDSIDGFDAAIFATEWTYTHEILSRVGEMQGRPCIYRDSFGFFYSSAQLQRVGDSDTFIRPASVVPRRGRVIQLGEDFPQESTDPGSRGLSLICGKTQSPDSSPIEPAGADLPPVVVLMHDVRDAQFECGVNGYRDIAHWTRATLDLLSERHDLDVHVKPHPNVLGECSDSTNTQFVSDLRRRYGSRVSWIHPERSLDDVFGNFSGRAFFITHHGTAGEELAAKGVPVLAAGLAPYSEFDVAQYWLNRGEYEDLLLTAEFDRQAHFGKSATAVLNEANEYRKGRLGAEAFERTYDLLGTWVGVPFPDGFYAAAWNQAWAEVNEQVTNLGIGAAISRLVLREFPEFRG